MTFLKGQSKKKVLSGLCPFLEALEKNPILFYFLEVTLCYFPTFLTHGAPLSIFKSAIYQISHFASTLMAFSDQGKETFLALKNLFNQIGPNWIIWASLPI